MKKLEQEEIKARLEKYLNLYGNKYPGMIESYIRRLINEVPISDVMRQVYHALDLYDLNENPFIAFADLVENKFGLEHNICEVGCGCYPALADVISKRQEKGTITGYDPYLVLTELGKIKLYKKNFENLENYDLIIGMAPCNATIPMIQDSLLYDKNMIISPCDCAHFPEWYDPGFDYINEWYNYVYNIMKYNSKTGKIEVDYLDAKTNYEFPIYTYKK
jgi:hypothetical protein